jgi:hypothetical protein
VLAQDEIISGHYQFLLLTEDNLYAKYGVVSWCMGTIMSIYKNKNNGWDACKRDM